MAQLAHDDPAPMALGYVQAWLADDYWTVAKISAELSGTDAERVAETLSPMTAARCRG